MFGPPRSRHMKANIVPPSSAQSVPARPRGAFGGPPRRRSGWDALKILGATLQDLDGSMGYGHRDLAMQGIRDRRAITEQEAQKTQFGKALENAGMPGMAGLSPEQMSFLYSMKRDKVADTKDLRNFNRDILESDRTFKAGREDRAADVAHREDRAETADEQWLANFDRGVLESDRSFAAGRDDAAHGRAIDYANLGIAEDRLALAEQEANAPSAGGTRMATPDEVAMYGFDPETTTAQIDANGNFKVIREQKPLLGAEAMARAATGIPNMKNAVTSLEGLLEDGNPGPTTQMTGLGRGGYKPGFDWGARAISGLPDFGLLEGLANFVGGKDYQQFEQAYNQFEAAALPIISGAAISESEAKRQLDAMKIRMGDNEQTRAAKLSNMRNMSDALAAAAGGDLDGLNAIFDNAGSRPNQGGGAPPQFPNAPPIGTVDNNYRYIGGDPSNPNSWERI